MRPRGRAGAALAALLLAGCVLPGPGISPYGKATTVYPRTGGRVIGELLAVSHDTVWLLVGGTPRGIGATEIRKINVERHRFGGTKTLVWMGVAGLGTGVALLMSCSAYNASGDDGQADCSGVLPGTTLFFLAFGGVLAFANEYSSKHHLSAADTYQLRAFARFPQGLPDSLAALGAPRAP